MSSDPELLALLRRLGLERYASTFDEEELTLELLLTMEPKMLRESLSDDLGLDAPAVEKLAAAMLQAGAEGKDEDSDGLVVEDNAEPDDDDDDGLVVEDNDEHSGLVMEANDEPSDDDGDGPTVEENDEPKVASKPPAKPPAAPLSQRTAASPAPSSTGRAAKYGSYTSGKWDSFDPDASSDEEADGMVAERGRYEVAVKNIRVRASPSTSAEVIGFKEKGEQVATDASLNGWVRTRDRLTDISSKEKRMRKGWMLIDGQSVGLGTLLRRVDASTAAQPTKTTATRPSATTPPAPKPAVPQPPPPKPIAAKPIAPATAPSPQPSPSPSSSSPARPSPSPPKKSFDYSKWDNLDSDDEGERDRERQKRVEKKKREEAEKPRGPWDGIDGKDAPGAPEKVDPQAEQMAAAMKGFDPAAHQQDRVNHLNAAKRMGQAKDGTNMADVELLNEQALRDAKQQGRQGNMIVDENGRFRIMSEEDMGGQTDKCAPSSMAPPLPLRVTLTACPVLCVQVPLGSE
jgi:hypothetical protein